MSLAGEIREFAFSQGVAAIGSAPVSKYAYSPQGHRPGDFLAETNTVITFTYPVNATAVYNLPRTRSNYMLEFDTVNRILFYTAHKIARILEERGYPSLPVSPEASPADLARLKADFSHKHSAVLCGLGRFGLNNLLVTPGHGPAVRLASVFTTAGIELDNPPVQEAMCDDCGSCLQKCPAGALNRYREEYSPHAGRLIDKEKCAHYIFNVLKGQRCGMCIKACLENFSR